eukprot:1146818-Pelagomonas_calceolata.AAC.2
MRLPGWSCAAPYFFITSHIAEHPMCVTQTFFNDCDDTLKVGGCPKGQLTSGGFRGGGSLGALSWITGEGESGRLGALLQPARSSLVLSLPSPRLALAGVLQQTSSFEGPLGSLTNSGAPKLNCLDLHETLSSRYKGWLDGAAPKWLPEGYLEACPLGGLMHNLPRWPPEALNVARPLGGLMHCYTESTWNFALYVIRNLSLLQTAFSACNSLSFFLGICSGCFMAKGRKTLSSQCNP